MSGGMNPAKLGWGAPERVAAEKLRPGDRILIVPAFDESPMPKDPCALRDGFVLRRVEVKDGLVTLARAAKAGHSLPEFRVPASTMFWRRTQDRKINMRPDLGAK